jgi:hypothetical protein
MKMLIFNILRSLPWLQMEAFQEVIAKQVFLNLVGSMTSMLSIFILKHPADVNF